jgi:RNA polymerase sigma-70 factor (ECF subfamily)
VELVRRRELKSVSERDAVAGDRTAAGAESAGRVLANPSLAPMPHARRQNPELTFKSIYEEYARFVWISLQRLGVQPADLGDLAHDVFVVVHRRLHTFDHTSRMTTWLFGICLRLAANYRRRQGRILSEAAVRARVSAAAAVEVPVDEMLVRRQERASAERVLATLTLEKRAVFIMFEIENLTCQEIADVMGVPVGTVYSRLHAARAQIQRIVSRTSAPADALVETQRSGMTSRAHEGDRDPRHE